MAAPLPAPSAVDALTSALTAVVREMVDEAVADRLRAAPSQPVPEQALPDDVADMLRSGVVEFDEAWRFLGIRNRQLACTMAARYLKRTEPVRRLRESGKPHDAAKAQREMLPRRNPSGAWSEIPVWKVSGRYKSRAEWLVPMVFPWWRP